MCVCVCGLNVSCIVVVYRIIIVIMIIFFVVENVDIIMWFVQVNRNLWLHCRKKPAVLVSKKKLDLNFASHHEM